MSYGYTQTYFRVVVGSVPGQYREYHNKASLNLFVWRVGWVGEEVLHSICLKTAIAVECNKAKCNKTR